MLRNMAKRKLNAEEPGFDGPARRCVATLSLENPKFLFFQGE